MPIIITKVGNLFMAKASSSVHEGWDWETDEPMEIDMIIEKLLSIGYHQTDIGDALYNVDPNLVGITKKPD